MEDNRITQADIDDDLAAHAEALGAMPDNIDEAVRHRPNMLSDDELQRIRDRNENE